MVRRILDVRVIARALRYPGFRWFILGRIAGAPTGQMRSVAQGWLVYNLTGSALALGWVSAARAVIMLILAPVAGVLSDRFDKRAVMFAARVVLIVNTLWLAAQVYADALQAWHIVVAAMLDGVAFSLMDPALQAIISELVDRDTLLNAVSVAYVIEGLMGVIGAVAAGLVIEAFGAGGVFLTMAFLFSLAAYTLFRLPKGTVVIQHNTSMRTEIVAGMRYLRASPVLIALVGLTFARLMLVQPFNTFLPVFAGDDLGLDAAGLGLLTSATSVGALFSAIVTAALGNTRHKGVLLLGSGIVGGLFGVLLFGVRAMPAPFIFAILAAGFNTTGDVLATTLIQSNCEAKFRGRVSAVVMMLWGLTSLIALPVGALVDRYGVSPVLIVLSVFVIIVHLATTVLRPNLRKLA